MKKSLLLILFAILISSISRAQVSGSSLLCPGFVYTYTANISGAVTYSWTTPVGWQIISGQGTSQIEVLCNENEGDVCADGLDAGGVFIAQNCLPASWGGDGNGWDVIKNTIGSCICSQYTIVTQSNGGSSPCGGCGSGTLSPNAVYGVYNVTLPLGTFLGLADGVTAYTPDDTDIITLYVYLIDTTMGLPNAVQIKGGTCASTINNSVQLFPCTPPAIVADVIPNPVCIGDTFTIKENTGLGTFPSYHWSATDTNVLFVSANGVDSIQGIYNFSSAASPLIHFTATDMFGCPYSGQITVDVINCVAPPVAMFSVDKDSICPNTCVTFTNQSSGAVSSQWLFSGAAVDTSTFNDPDPVCYPLQGDYDVTLIVTNAGGNDTLTVTNALHIFPPAAAQNVILINDTLFSNQGFASYQWFYNNSLIAGATSYFYAATLNGNYTVVSRDANGCESTFEILNIILNAETIERKSFTIHPNPAKNFIEIGADDFKNSSVEIFNCIGEKVYSVIPESRKTHFAIDQLMPGIYFVKFSGSGTSQIEKLIIAE